MHTMTTPHTALTDRRLGAHTDAFTTKDSSYMLIAFTTGAQACAPVVKAISTRRGLCRVVAQSMDCDFRRDWVASCRVGARGQYSFEPIICYYIIISYYLWLLLYS